MLYVRVESETKQREEMEARMEAERQRIAAEREAEQQRMEQMF